MKNIEELKQQIVDYLQKNGSKSPTKIAHDLKIGYYIFKFYLIPELIKDKKVELTKRTNTFYELKLKWKPKT